MQATLTRALSVAALLLLVAVLGCNRPGDSRSGAAAGNYPGGPKAASDGQARESVDWSVGARQIASAHSYAKMEKFLSEMSLPEKTKITHFESALFSPDSKYLAAGKDDGTTILWEVPSFKKRATIQEQGLMAFALGGEVLVTAAEYHERTKGSGPRSGRRIRAWRVPSGKPVAALADSKLAQYSQPLRVLAAAPDGRYLATIGDDGVKLWEMAAGSLVGEVSGHQGGSWHRLQFSPDGKYLASYSYDYTSETVTFKVSEVPSGKPVKPFCENPYLRQPFAFSADSKLLATGFNDGEQGGPAVWHVPSGELLCYQVGHGYREKNSMAFSPGGRHIVSLGTFEVTLWEPDV